MGTADIDYEDFHPDIIALRQGSTSGSMEFSLAAANGKDRACRSRRVHNDACSGRQQQWLTEPVRARPDPAIISQPDEVFDRPIWSIGGYFHGRAIRQIARRDRNQADGFVQSYRCRDATWRGHSRLRQSREHGRWRQVDRIPFRGPAFHPTHDHLDFEGRQARVVTVRANPFHRAPGWHAPFEHFFADRLGPRPRVIVSGQRKRRPALVMATCTPLVNDAGDFLRPGELCGDRLVGVRGKRADQAREKCIRLSRQRPSCLPFSAPGTDSSTASWRRKPRRRNRSSFHPNSGRPMRFPW